MSLWGRSALGGKYYTNVQYRPCFSQLFSPVFFQVDIKISLSFSSPLSLGLARRPKKAFKSPHRKAKGENSISILACHLSQLIIGRKLSYRRAYPYSPSHGYIPSVYLASSEPRVGAELVNAASRPHVPQPPGDQTPWDAHGGQQYHTQELDDKGLLPALVMAYLTR